MKNHPRCPNGSYGKVVRDVSRRWIWMNNLNASYNILVDHGISSLYNDWKRYKFFFFLIGDR